jgi:hypothetical protein
MPGKKFDLLFKHAQKSASAMQVAFKNKARDNEKVERTNVREHFEFGS